MLSKLVSASLNATDEYSERVDEYSKRAEQNYQMGLNKTINVVTQDIATVQVGAST